MNKKILFFIIFLGALVIYAGFWIFVWVRKNDEEMAMNQTYTEENSVSDCANNESPEFTRYITDLDLVDFIVPPGHTEEYPDGNVFKSHSYIRGENVMPIYAPVDSTLFRGVYFLEGEMGQYALFFDVSCEIYYLFDHVVDPVYKISEIFTEEPVLSTTEIMNVEPTEFRAGELIGYSIGQDFPQWDFGVYNRNVNNPFPEINAPIMPRDKNAVCPYDFFPDEMKEEYYSLFGYHLDGDPPDNICNWR